MIKPFPELLRHGKHNMAIPRPGEERPSYIIYPLICVYLCTGETETALATERNLLYLTTPEASISHKPVLRISASQHLFNYSIIILRLGFWIHRLKLSPVIYEYLLEYILVVIWAHAPIITKRDSKYNYLSIIALMCPQKGNSYSIELGSYLFRRGDEDFHLRWQNSNFS